MINQWVSLTNRDRPLADVLRDAQAAWQAFEAIVQMLPEDTFVARERLARPDGPPLGARLLAEFIQHFHEEHEPQIRAWLGQLTDTPVVHNEANEVKTM